MTKNARLENLVMAAAVMTTDPPPADPPSGGDPAGGSLPPEGVKLEELFTPEEITAKQEAVKTAKAEEERRSKLTDEQRAEEDRTAAEKKAQEEKDKAGAPEKYQEFQVPQGMSLDKDMVEEFEPIAREFNLSQEKAQKLVDMGSKLVQKQIDGMMTAHQSRVTQWLKDAEADPEIGADIKKGKDSATLRAFNTITGGSEKAKAMVDELGIGNHPEFLRIFYRISQKMREDSFEIPGTGGNGNKRPEEIMYSSSMAKA